MKNRLIKASLFTVLCLQPLTAHQIWIQEADAGYEVVYGERVTDQDPLPFAKVNWVRGFTANKYIDKLALSTEAYGDKPDAGHVYVQPFNNYNVITAKMTNGYYVKVKDDASPKGEKYLKDPVYSNIDATGKEVIKELYSIKFAKYITKWSCYLKKPIGQRLEIVPMSDVTKLQEGDSLKFKIFYEGKPVTGTNTYIYQSTNPLLGKEDNPKTHIQNCPYQTIKVGPSGLQTVVVKHKVMLNDEETKYISIASALSFYTQ